MAEDQQPQTAPDDHSDAKQPVLSENGKETMHVKVYSPFHVYFDGRAESITADNDTGTFDILPRHKNFLTLLRPCDVIVRTGTQNDEKIPIITGIMHVKSDEVVVFLDV